jgi:hypothetical protein
MSSRETVIIERERITEALALLDLARYVLKAGQSGEDELTLGADELQGLDCLIESAKALIR